MFRNMVTSLLEHERIRTTDAKAKEVRRIAEKMITLGKRGGLHARRRALRIIRRREVAAKVFDELAERYFSLAEDTFFEFLYDGWEPWRGSVEERLYHEIEALVRGGAGQRPQTNT